MASSSQAQAPRSPLAAQLFAKTDVHVFAVLDGASCPDLVKKLCQHTPEYCCLYRGELPPDIATVAPYLVQMQPETEFAEWVLTEGWGAHWGIFAAANNNLRTLRNHFRQFLKVELPDRRTAFFRFYDPRVLKNFLPVCNASELNAFFGPIQSFVLEGETPAGGARYSFQANGLKTEPFHLKGAS